MTKKDFLNGENFIIARPSAFGKDLEVTENVYRYQNFRLEWKSSIEQPEYYFEYVDGILDIQSNGFYLNTKVLFAPISIFVLFKFCKKLNRK